MPRIHVCQFDTTEHLTGRKRTYAAIKAAVLEAGRFSVFEATDSLESAKLFERLDADPELERVEMPYPWIGVRRKKATRG